ncbi:DUF2085 domain-containing protein [bacterium]|nr:DUF2085 domain-containing protein [bacterium]
MAGFFQIIGGAVCHRLPELTPLTSDGVGFLCCRCTGIYAAVALVAVYLICRGRLGGRLVNKRSRGVLFSFAALLVVDELLTALTLWSPPNWWRVLSGGLGGVALFLLLVSLLGNRWRRQLPERGEVPLLTLRESLLLPILAAGLILSLQTTNAVGGWLPLVLSLLGEVIAFTTAGALLLSAHPAKTKLGWMIYSILAVILGLAVWLLFGLLRSTLG